MKNIFTPSEIEKAKAVLNSTLLKKLLEKNSRRLNVLTDFFTENKIPHNVVILKNHKHCVLRFNKNFYTNSFATKTLIAHYDRCGNEFGANDNSAACVQLAFFAKELLHEKTAHNIQIIFTDGEELNKKSLSTQGAFWLGLGLRKLGLHTEQLVLVLDLCGRGDFLVFSDAGIFLRDRENTASLKKTQKLAVKTADENKLPHLILPTAFSDNAGLLASGINAQLITVLPQNEAESFHSLLQVLREKLPKEKFDNFVKKNILESYETAESEKIKPATWKLPHTKQDKFESLNIEAFALINKFLHGLKKLKVTPPLS
ncbi:MAG: M28 family peptidase [Treponemataceae bacterium]